ncbi:MAG: MGMT family protein [Candidatus Pacearchaeota archaeon]
MSLKQKVFSYLKSLKKGEVITYKQLAEKFKTSPRAIGKIVYSNSDKSVPCYKVVRSEGSLGGYNGLHAKSKEKLLKDEGIETERLKKGQ